MSTATTFRAAVGAGILFLILAVIAFINHFIRFIALKTFDFGLKAGLLLLLIALACGIYANYNRPATGS